MKVSFAIILGLFWYLADAQKVPVVTKEIMSKFNQPDMSNTISVSFDFKNVTSIAPDAFDGSSPLIVYLTMIENQLTSIGPRTFSKLTNLRNLYLTINFITSIDATAFEGLSGLKLLALQNNPLDLPQTVFSGLYSLEEIRMSKCRLTEISDKLFEDTENLMDVEIWQNRISTIHPMAFQNARKLVILDLTDNRISSLDPLVFYGLSALQSIRLSNNRITSLDRRIFMNLPSLISLGLDGNQIKIPADIFRPLSNLRSLSIGMNSQVTAIDANMFRGLFNLEYIYMPWCEISSIDTEAFIGLPKLGMLTLYNNPLPAGYKPNVLKQVDVRI